MSIKGIENWQILQQKEGYSDCTITYEVSGWLKNPVIPEEKRVSKLLKCVRVRVIDETTGREIIPWTNGTDIENNKSYCHISNIPVGGLYSLQAETVFQNQDGSTFAYPCGGARHIGVGDVYLIAGQSNAQGTAMGPYDEEAMLGVSVYMNDSWDLAVHPLGGSGVSPFLTFAKRLKRTLGYPIGLIPRAIGGSPISTWVNGGIYMERLRYEVENGLGNIKGVLWYQGCTDADFWETTNIYESQFTEFLKEINDLFGNVPIITFQLDRLRNEESEKEERYNVIRETQRQIALKNDNCYIIPTIDLTHMSDHIHIGCSDAQDLGLRTARLVLDKIYNKEKNYEAPTISKVEKTGKNEILITFNNVVKNLTCVRAFDVPYPIQLREEEKNIEICEMVFEKNTVKIKSEEKLSSRVKISINCGINPISIVYDDISKLPVVCVYDYIIM